MDEPKIPRGNRDADPRKWSKTWWADSEPASKHAAVLCVDAVKRLLALALRSEVSLGLMTPFDFRPRTRVLFGAGEFNRLGEVAREMGGTRCLLVADPGMLETGYVKEAVRTLKARRNATFSPSTSSRPVRPRP